MKRPRLGIAMLVFAATLLPALGWPFAARAAGDDLEAAIKATYLTKFGDFVEWPPGAMPANSFNLCVIGAPAFGNLLDRAAEGLTVQAHPIALRSFAAPADPESCQLAFVSGPTSQAVAQALQIMRGWPVLTVTDRQQDAQSRGIVNFIIRDGRVRFEINRKAALANHLAISSKLLDLALREQE